MIDNFVRYQSGLTLQDLYPSIKGFCACGCKRPLVGQRKKWATDKCRDKAAIQFFVIKGDSQVIKYQLEQRDRGICAICGLKTKVWHADHIKPVFMGGGACSLSNFQTLCPSCHLAKTKSEFNYFTRNTWFT